VAIVNSRVDKIISAWAVEGDFDLDRFKSNFFGKATTVRSHTEFPRQIAAWFTSNDASRKDPQGTAAEY
jgi:predicted NUDIX family NTP pyrophosphohydrolase